METCLSLLVVSESWERMDGLLKKKKSKVSLTIDFCKSLVIYLYALLSYFNNMKSGENKVFITEFWTVCFLYSPTYLPFSLIRMPWVLILQAYSLSCLVFVRECHQGPDPLNVPRSLLIVTHFVFPKSFVYDSSILLIIIWISLNLFLTFP